MNDVMKYIRTHNFSETNNLIKVASIIEAENMGADIKKKKKKKKNGQPLDEKLRNDGGNEENNDAKKAVIFDQKLKEELRNVGKYDILKKAYRLERKGL